MVGKDSGPTPLVESQPVLRTAAQHLVGTTVRLRAFLDDDVDRLAAWSLDARVGISHSGTSAPSSLAEQRAMFARWGVNDPREGVGFAIEAIDGGHHVGAVHIRVSGVRTGTVGMLLGPEHVGRGYGTDALRLAVGHAVDEMQLHRVEGRIFAMNEPSLRMCTRAGFVREGRLRHASRFGGQWVDQIVMAFVDGLDT